MTSTFCSWSATESSQEVMFSSALVCLFVCKQAGLCRNYTPPIFTKFTGKAARGPMKKRLDFVGNPDGSRSMNFLNELCHCGIGNGKGCS